MRKLDATRDIIDILNVLGANVVVDYHEQSICNDTGYVVFADIRYCRVRSSSPFRDYADRNLGSASLSMLHLL